MKKWLRRIRGALGLGLAWGLAWLGAGLILLLIIGFDAADVPFPLFFGLLGFLSGVTFSVVLGIVEGRRSFDQMSLPRFAAWGGLGGLLLCVIFVSAVALGGDTTPLEHLLVLGPVFSMAGAGSAAGSLALARRAEPEPLDAGAGGAEPGLTAGEERERLGGGG